MARLSSMLVAALLLAATARPARATDAALASAAISADRPAERSGSYRGQIAAADLAAASLYLGSMGVLTVPASTLFVGTPTVIHMLHHHPGRAALSAGLRIALPLAGGLLGQRIGCEDTKQCTGPAILGGVAGALTASIIDIALLATESPPPGDDAGGTDAVDDRDGKSRIGIGTAGLAPMRDGVVFTLGGRF